MPRVPRHREEGLAAAAERVLSLALPVGGVCDCCRAWLVAARACAAAEYSYEMVRMTVLASGSRGNCTVVTAGRTTVLVDAGVSCREILKRMQMAGEDPALLDAILVTHEHQDHVQGLSVLARRLGIPVFFTEATHRAWMRWMQPQQRQPRQSVPG